MKQSFIYALVCPKAGEIRYVGKTIDPAKRLYMHIYDSQKRDTYKERWISKLIVAGLKPQMMMLEAVPENGDWKEAERRWIAIGAQRGWPLTNLAEGGVGSACLTDEARERKKIAMSAPECRAKMSESAKRRWADPNKRAVGVASLQSPERRKRSSETAILRATPEYRKKMSEKSKLAWADKDKRARIVAGITPEVKRAVSDSARAMWKKAGPSKKQRMKANLRPAPSLRVQ